MVEIYLNPDNENIWEGMDGDGAGNANQVNMEAVKICERLLREIKRKPKSLRHEMLECHALIGTKTRPNIELALSRFVETLKVDSECVPALRGMAMALLMLKQTPKARNCLKRIHKMKYDPTFAEDFEVSFYFCDFLSGSVSSVLKLLTVCIPRPLSSPSICTRLAGSCLQICTSGPVNMI